MFNTRILKDVSWMNKNIFKEEYFQTIQMAFLTASN